MTEVFYKRKCCGCDARFITRGKNNMMCKMCNKQWNEVFEDNKLDHEQEQSLKCKITK